MSKNYIANQTPDLVNFSLCIALYSRKRKKMQFKSLWVLLAALIFFSACRMSSCSSFEVDGTTWESLSLPKSEFGELSCHTLKSLKDGSILMFGFFEEEPLSDCSMQDLSGKCRVPHFYISKDDAQSWVEYDLPGMDETMIFPKEINSLLDYIPFNWLGRLLKRILEYGSTRDPHNHITAVMIKDDVIINLNDQLYRFNMTSLEWKKVVGHTNIEQGTTYFPWRNSFVSVNIASKSSRLYTFSKDKKSLQFEVSDTQVATVVDYDGNFNSRLESLLQSNYYYHNGVIKRGNKSGKYIIKIGEVYKMKNNVLYATASAGSKDYDTDAFINLYRSRDGGDHFEQVFLDEEMEKSPYNKLRILGVSEDKVLISGHAMDIGEDGTSSFPSIGISRMLLLDTRTKQLTRIPFASDLEFSLNSILGFDINRVTGSLLSWDENGLHKFIDKTSEDNTSKFKNIAFNAACYDLSLFSILDDLSRSPQNVKQDFMAYDWNSCFNKSVSNLSSSLLDESSIYSPKSGLMLDNIPWSYLRFGLYTRNTLSVAGIEVDDERFYGLGIRSSLTSRIDTLKTRAHFMGPVTQFLFTLEDGRILLSERYKDLNDEHMLLSILQTTTQTAHKANFEADENATKSYTGIKRFLDLEMDTNFTTSDIQGKIKDDLVEEDCMVTAKGFTTFKKVKLDSDSWFGASTKISIAFNPYTVNGKLAGHTSVFGINPDYKGQALRVLRKYYSEALGGDAKIYLYENRLYAFSEGVIYYAYTAGGKVLGGAIVGSLPRSKPSLFEDPNSLHLIDNSKMVDIQQLL